ncbi:MAG: hypothetical protein ABSF60_15445 [Verrucomicrobiota bacterium]
MGVHQIAAVFEHRLARGRFLGCGGCPGLWLDRLDGVTGRHGHFGPDARPSTIEAEGGEMAPGNLWLRCRNGFWAEWRFLAAGGYCCGLAFEHFITLSRLVLAHVLECSVGKQTMPLRRRPGLRTVVDEQPDRIRFRASHPILVMIGNQKTGRDLFLVASVLFLASLGGIWTGHFLWLRSQGGQYFIFIVLGVVTSLMGIGLVVWTRGAFSEWKAILICSGFLLLGLSAYFYLPIASMMNPPINWGYPRTVEGFFHVLTRGQYENMNPTADVRRFLEQVRQYFVMAGNEFGWPYLLMCLIPFCFLHQMAASERRWILGLLPAYVCLALLMLAVLNPSVDRQSQELDKVYFSASYIILALWMGYGLVVMGARLTRPAEQPQKLISPSDHV